jgi:hypothetical protein
MDTRHKDSAQFLWSMVVVNCLTDILYFETNSRVAGITAITAHQRDALRYLSILTTASNPQVSHVQVNRKSKLGLGT